jgi:hypothetical protein
MTTNFKKIKTVITIFLALVISSCQDDLTVQQEYLLSDPNQGLSKKSEAYWGRFIEGGFSGPNLLESLVPAGNSSSQKFTIQWPFCTTGETCKPIFDLTVTGADSGLDYHPNYRVQISLHKRAGKITGFQMWLHDGNYSFATDKISFETFLDFPAAEPNVVIPVNKTVILYRYLNGAGNQHRESVGEISIGSLEYCRKDQACAGL